MLKLEPLSAEPFWLDVLPGVRIQFRPVSVAALRKRLRQSAIVPVIPGRSNRKRARNYLSAVALAVLVAFWLWLSPEPSQPPDKGRRLATSARPCRNRKSGQMSPLHSVHLGNVGSMAVDQGVLSQPPSSGLLRVSLTSGCVHAG